MPIRSPQLTMIALGALLALGTVGCKNPKVSKKRGRTVKASIAEFDPNADYELDLSKFGSERPDEYAVQQAFSNAFVPMDACVAAAKKKMGLGEAASLDGEVEIAVQLDPLKGTPSGVNATLPNKYASNATLRTCIREAVGAVEFPKYNGTPRVAEFSTELDAGSEYEEAW